MECEIRVPSTVINGAVQGNVYSSKHLELAPKSKSKSKVKVKVKGNVFYAVVEMAAGRGSMTALFTARMPTLSGTPPAQMPKRTVLAPGLPRKADRTLNLTKLVGLKIMPVENHVKQPLSALEYTDVSCGNI